MTQAQDLQVVALVVLVFAAAFFAASEGALISVSRLRVRGCLPAICPVRSLLPLALGGLAPAHSACRIHRVT